MLEKLRGKLVVDLKGTQKVVIDNIHILTEGVVDGIDNNVKAIDKTEEISLAVSFFFNPRQFLRLN